MLTGLIATLALLAGTAAYCLLAAGCWPSLARRLDGQSAPIVRPSERRRPQLVRVECLDLRTGVLCRSTYQIHLTWMRPMVFRYWYYQGNRIMKQHKHGTWALTEPTDTTH